MIQVLAQQFNTGGLFMWIILSVFVFALAITIERFFYFYLYCKNDGDRIAGELVKAVKEGNVQVVKGKRLNGRTPMQVLLGTAVECHTKGLAPEFVLENVERTAIKQVQRITRRINYISLSANMATLLGLLGTVSGLQVCFGSLGNVDAASKASMLASGISQAMNTTAFGLIVAVPCMAMYTALNNRSQTLIKDIEDAVGQFIIAIKGNG